MSTTPRSPHYKGSTKSFDELKKEGLIIEVIPKDDKGTWSLVIKPRALDIVWGGDGRYWHFGENPTDPVELREVCWLEVNGSIELKNLAPGEYKLAFEVRLTPKASGWDSSPVYLMAKVGGERYVWKSADLSQQKKETRVAIPIDPPGFKITIPQGLGGHEKLLFRMYEIWKGRWKEGLVLHQVVISRLV